MAKTKKEKEKIIEDLKKRILFHRSIIFVNFKGLDSKSFFKLRKRLKKEECILKVTKKTLLNKALKDLKMENLAKKIEEIKTQLALVFSLKEEIISAKICYQFSKEFENLKILGAGIKKNQEFEFLNSEEIIALAKLPCREELLRRFLASLENSYLALVNVLRGSLKSFIFILNQKVNQ